MKTIVTEGKVVEVTDEGWAKIKAVLIADKKPKFEPTNIYQFRVSVQEGVYPIIIGFNAEYQPDSLMGFPYTTKSLQSVRGIIATLHSAIDSVEANK